jgi:NADH dehydrogenase [ubiquinone] 1 alpha subcomplex assembly factor 5
MSQAAAAVRVRPAVEGEGLAASGAGRPAEEIQRRPAWQAEQMRCGNDHAASRATRRQGEVERRGNRLAQQGGEARHAREARVRTAMRQALAADAATRHIAPVSDIEPFDRVLRRRRRDRCAAGFAAHSVLRDHITGELVDRLADISRRFDDVLDLGCADGALGRRLALARLVSADAGFAFARAAGGVQCDEDRLPFADASFDLIISAGVLDEVNDLPGALTLARRLLRPDGLFLAGFVGGGSLPRLRGALLAADMAAGTGVSPHVHPLVDLRAAADLLVRAGLNLTVTDGERLTLRYRSLAGLLDDLRGAGASNILHARARTPVTRQWLAAANDAFAGQADADGRISEQFELIYLTGWSPSADQPKPAKRGSATQSLAEALKPRR